MNISPKLQEVFSKALERPENTNEDGSINWNFMDADCYMEMCDGVLFDTREEGQAYVDQFDYLADCYMELEEEHQNT